MNNTLNSSLPFSQACARNQDPILQVLASYFKSIKSVLEIGSGSAQHAVHFAKAFAHLNWQTSDQSHYIPGIIAQLKHARLANIQMPILADVNDSSWVRERQFDAVYTANTLHIMNEDEVEKFFRHLPKLINKSGYCFVYGPFKYNGEFTSVSNAEFDQALREREGQSSIKEFNQLNQWANEVGLHLVDDIAMPANNQCLVWQRES